MVKQFKVGAFALLTIALSSCQKVEPGGFIKGSSNVDDRYQQSMYFFDQLNENNPGILLQLRPEDNDSYSFLLGADFHTTSDTTRMVQFFHEAIDPLRSYLFCSILGDIAETKPEYYLQANEVIKRYASAEPENGKTIPFYPIVGNHDITHNGWAYYTQIMGTSTYFVLVFPYFNDAETPRPDDVYWMDMHIFLDSANGTLGKGQLQEFLPSIFSNEDGSKARDFYRNVFVYTHNPFFRPRLDAVASNFPKDELYYLIDYFADNQVNYVFSGHIHKHGENEFRGVHFKILDVFNEVERPAGGELCRVTVNGKGNENIKCEFFKTGPVDVKK